MAIVNKLCSPAIIYLIFALTQIIIDIFKSLYNQAFFKFVQMVFFTLLLHILCSRGLGIVSWIIVFIPFILMTVITTILMLVFGLNPAEGDYTVDVDDTGDDDDDSDDDDNDDDNSDDDKDDDDSENDNDKKDYNFDELNGDNGDSNENDDNKEIIIVNPEQRKAYKIENLRNRETNKPTNLNVTDTNTFIKNISRRI